MLIFDRKQQNSVKQLSFNLKIKETEKNSIFVKICFDSTILSSDASLVDMETDPRIKNDVLSFHRIVSGLFHSTYRSCLMFWSCS